jgi:hypothetical protein
VQDFNRIAVKTEAIEDNIEMWGLKGLTISGYMDPTVIYNKRQDRAGFQFLNPVGDDGYNYDNSYFGAAVIDFQKETDSGTKWRLTLAPNRGVGAVVDGTNIVHEATVSVPLTDLQTRFIAGQIPDWSGYEYLQPTLQPFITHNLLFDFTLPTAYTGVGVDITRGKWWTRAAIANMNGTRKDSRDKTPVFTYRVDYSKGEFNGFGFAGVHGRATNFNNCRDEECSVSGDSRVDLFEVDGYFIRGDWTVQGQASYGRQNAASVLAGLTGDVSKKAQWWGLSGLVGYNITPRLQALARADYVNNEKNGGGLLGYTSPDDRNGIGPDPTLGCVDDPSVAGCDKGANRYALSFGLKYLWNQQTTLKAEYRYDGANLPVFIDVRSGSYEKSNHLFGASVLVAF